MRQPLVLIIGCRHDACASLTSQVLLQRGVQTISFEPDELLSRVSLNWSVDAPSESSFLIVDSMRIGIAAVSGVLARLKPQPVPDSGATPTEQQYIFGELQATLFAFLQALECRVINRPAPGVSHRVAVATVERAETILEDGFLLPRVLTTSDSGEAAAFWKAGGRRMLVRPPSGWEPWRLVEHPETLAELEPLLDQHPLYLQECPAGQWLRVLVVGETLFGVSGDVAAMFDPGAAPPVRRVELPADLQNRCLRLAWHFHLDFAQVDLIQTGTGDYYALDISAWPEFEPYGAELQRVLAEVLADRLTGEENDRSHDSAIWRTGRHGDGLRLPAPVVSTP